MIIQNGFQVFVVRSDIFMRSKERGGKKTSQIFRNADIWCLKQEQQQVSAVVDLMGRKQTE